MNIKSFIIITYISVSSFLYSGAEAKTTKQLSINNEYGGKTIEITYADGENSDHGVIKEVLYGDKNEVLREIDNYYNKDVISKRGYYRVNEYYEGDKNIAKEKYYTAQYAVKNSGITRVISHFKKMENVTKLNCSRMID